MKGVRFNVKGVRFNKKGVRSPRMKVAPGHTEVRGLENNTRKVSERSD